MKKIFMFAAVAAMVSLTACSSKEGENAAQDESVAGSTDQIEAIQETAGELESLDQNLPSPTEEAMEQTGDVAKDAVEKAQDIAKDAVEKAQDKAKDVMKDAQDKANEMMKDAQDKAKDMMKGL